MARKRRSTNTGGNTKMAGGLPQEMIAQLLSNTRQKGQYVRYMNDFLASGDNGCEVGERWVDLRGKSGSTLKQGFDGAKDKKEVSDGAEHVKVAVQKEEDGTERVFLINLRVVAEEQGIELPELVPAAASA